ncbi:MAG TPA: PKD domain-containing protein [Conexibacter sp.]|nr:PKD domain-containing protein [Conexibacter sp.]
MTILTAAVCMAPAASAEGPRAAYATTVNGDELLPFDAFTGVAGSPLALGGRLWGVAITPDGATAYVAGEGTNDVIPVDTATDTAGTPIPVGSMPRTIGITPDGSTAYVANYGSNTVTPIDTATNTAGAPIAVGLSPHGIAIAPDGATVYVTNLDSGSISAIDTATDAVVATIPAGILPYTLAITPDGATVYVTDLAGSNVFPIDTATNTAGTPIPIGASTFGIAVSPDGATVYVSPSSTGTVVPIDTATNTPGTPIPAGASPEGLAITPDGSTMYVTDVVTDTVTPLDLSDGTTGTPMPTAQDPMTVAITPNQSPTAAFAASAGGLTATLDASAASDADGTIAGYAWDFGDGQTATGSQPTVSHAYAQPGSYTVTLTVTDDEGCSEALVYTGQTASCTGSPGARVAHTVTVAAPALPVAPSPPAAPAASTLPAHPTSRQAIERFTLDSPCVRPARDGKARIGLRLRLAQPGSVAVLVYRAVTATNTERCPARNPARHYGGTLRGVAALENVATQPVVVASVQRRLTRSFDLRPGLYRISVRAHGSDGRLTRAAHRWVRVLARSLPS